MDLIIIIIFVVLILSCMLTAYVPYELQPLAAQAGFSKFSLRFCILRLQKTPIKYLFEQYIKLVDANISVEFEDFKKYWSTKPDKLENTINIILNAKNAGIDIPFNEIEKYNLTEENSLKFFSVLKKLEENKMKLSQNEIFALINSNFDIDAYFLTIENTAKFNINISKIDTKKINLEEINEYLKTIQKAKNIGIDYSPISEKDISWKAKNIILSNLITINQLNINIPETEIFNLYFAGVNTNDYIKAIELQKSNKFENIDNEQIKTHFISGGNSKEVLEAILFARANNTEIDTSLIFKLDLENKNESIKDIIKKAVIVQEINIPAASPIVLQDGLQIIPKIKLSVKENLNSKSLYIDKQGFFNKINDLISDEILNYKTYKEILNNIKTISEKVLSELNKDNNIEQQIFSVKNIKITDIQVNADTLSELKKIELNEKEKEAKLNLIKAKTKFQEDMAEALKNGNISFKDYQKEKHIFGSFNDGELPYTD